MERQAASYRRVTPLALLILLLSVINSAPHSRVAAEPAGNSMVWPTTGRVTSLVGDPRGGRRHGGIDIAAPTGSPVYAAFGGKVISAGTLSGYGNLIRVRHAEDYVTYYAHLSSLAVDDGSRVDTGQLLGKVGCTGSCSGPHLHFEVRRDDSPIDFNGSTGGKGSSVRALAPINFRFPGLTTDVRSFVAAGSLASGYGYWLAGSDGSVYAFGKALHRGGLKNKRIEAPIAGFAALPSGRGYWLAATDGSVYAVGRARRYGSMEGTRVDRTIAGMTSSPTGRGYWLVGKDGSVFDFGNAGFFCSMSQKPRRPGIVAIAPTPSGDGYWFVNRNGALFNFGDARPYGSIAEKHLLPLVVSMVASATDEGYWLLDKSGGVFNFGDAGTFGSLERRQRKAPIVAMAPTATGRGYWLVDKVGNVFDFGDAESARTGFSRR